MAVRLRPSRVMATRALPRALAVASLAGLALTSLTPLTGVASAVCANGLPSCGPGSNPNDYPPQAAFKWSLAGAYADGFGATVETNYDFTNESMSSPVLLDACDSHEPYGILRYQWTIGGQSITAPDCKFTWQRPVSATYQTANLQLTVVPKPPPFPRLPRATALSVQHAIRYRDVAIASLGDSAASGEGAPQDDVTWTAAYCGRSGWAASAQAALQIQASLADTTVHFWHLACAGARIDNQDATWWAGNALSKGGMLDPYAGVTGSVNLQPQTTRLAQLEHDSGLTPAKVLLTVGANETEWAAALEACLPSGLAGPVGQDACLAVYTPHLQEAVQTVTPHYAALAPRLNQLVPADRVYVTGYFDPIDTFSPQPPVCAGEPFAWPDLRNVSASLEGSLQSQVRTAAQTYHWTFIDGFQQDFQGHGVCSNSPWINSSTVSQSTQNNILGTWHANRTGQLDMARRIEQQIGSIAG